jgi:hypothetical protein
MIFPGCLTLDASWLCNGAYARGRSGKRIRQPPRGGQDRAEKVAEDISAAGPHVRVDEWETDIGDSVGAAGLALLLTVIK